MGGVKRRKKETFRMGRWGQRGKRRFASLVAIVFYVLWIMATVGNAVRIEKQREELVDFVDAAAAVKFANPSGATNPVVEYMGKKLSKGMVVGGSRKSKRRRRRSLLQSSMNPINVSNMQFEIDYQLSGLTATEAAYIEGIVEEAVGRFTDAVQIKRPVVGNLYLSRVCRDAWQWTGSGTVECGAFAPPGSCFDAQHDASYFDATEVCTRNFEGDCTTVSGGMGAAADFILYVTAVDNDSCGEGTGLEDSLAQGGYCALEESTGRPVAGAINFCPSQINPDTDSPSAGVALHEIIHALVFSSELYQFYIDDFAQTIGEGQVVNTVDGNEVIVTPNVLQQARLQSNCSTAPGGILEENGGVGTEDVHWESRYFQREIMLGQTPQAGVPPVLSNLTLGLLQDSGWYVPDYAYGEPLWWGWQKGCDFISENCATRPLPEILEDEFCETTGTTGCTWDHSAVGVCSPMSLNVGCRMVQPYTNVQCLVENGGSTDDESDATDPNSAAFWGQTFGENARCVPMLEGDEQERTVREGFRITTYTRTAIGGGCFDLKCIDNQVYVILFGDDVACPEGEMVDLRGNGFGSGQIGPCPKAENICPWLSTGVGGGGLSLFAGSNGTTLSSPSTAPSSSRTDISNSSTPDSGNGSDSDSDNGGGGGGLDTTLIIVIAVIGGVVLFGLFVCILLTCCRGRKC